MSIPKKPLKAGALQFVVLIAVIISLLMTSLVLLVYLHRFFYQDTRKVSDLLDASDKAFADLNASSFSQGNYNGKINEDSNGDIAIQNEFWGLFEKTGIQVSKKGKSFERLALVGGWLPNSDRTALYLADSYRPLVMVGNARVQGTSYLPVQGVRPGNMAGHGFYGTYLIEGNIKISDKDLPTFNNECLIHLGELIAKINSIQPAEREPKGIWHQSFYKETQLLGQYGKAVLSDVELKGNIIYYSTEAIQVTSSAILENVLLIAPEIEFLDGFKGNIQAIATSRITAGKNCLFSYPSALIVLEETRSQENHAGEEYQDVPARIAVGSGSILEGVLLYQGLGKEESLRRPEVVLEEDSIVLGELYCKGNLTLTGRVTGSVWASNFLVHYNSSIYQNHLFDGAIQGAELHTAYAGLIFSESKRRVVQWLY